VEKLPQLQDERNLIVGYKAKEIVATVYIKQYENHAVGFGSEVNAASTAGGKQRGERVAQFTWVWSKTNRFLSISGSRL